MCTSFISYTLSYKDTIICAILCLVIQNSSYLLFWLENIGLTLCHVYMVCVCTHAHKCTHKLWPSIENKTSRHTRTCRRLVYLHIYLHILSSSLTITCKHLLFTYLILCIYTHIQASLHKIHILSYIFIFT